MFNYLNTSHYFDFNSEEYISCRSDVIPSLSLVDTSIITPLWSDEPTSFLQIVEGVYHPKKHGLIYGVAPHRSNVPTSVLSHLLDKDNTWELKLLLNRQDQLSRESQTNLTARQAHKALAKALTITKSDNTSFSYCTVHKQREDKEIYRVYRSIYAVKLPCTTTINGTLYKTVVYIVFTNKENSKERVDIFRVESPIFN